MGFFDDAKDTINRGAQKATDAMDSTRSSVNNRLIETSGFATEFIRFCQDAYNQGWHEANGGNASYLLSAEEAADVTKRFDLDAATSWAATDFNGAPLAGRLILMTASGAHMRDIATNPRASLGLIKVSADGASWRVVWGFEGGKPTSELPMHLRVLAGDPERRVVLHAHPENIIALSALHDGSSQALTRKLWSAMAEAVIAFPKGVSIIGWMVPGTVELGAAVAEELTLTSAAVLQHHGVVCTGPTLSAAFGTCHTIEKAASIRLKMGDAPGISDDGIQQIIQRYIIG